MHSFVKLLRASHCHLPYLCVTLQLENLGNFIKAILAYGLKPNDIFEANDLFENGNMTQVQTTLLALASMVSKLTAHGIIVDRGGHFCSV